MGVTASFGAGSWDIYLIKTDAQGNEIWSKTFGGSEDDYGDAVQQTSDGGYIIAGMTKSYGAGNGDVYLIKTDADGNEIWSKTFGGSDHDYSESVQQTTDGGYIIVGYQNGDVYLLKTDADGNQLWDKNFGSSGKDYGAYVQQITSGSHSVTSVQQSSDGRYTIVGTTKSSGMVDTDVYLVHYIENGYTTGGGGGGSGGG